MAAPADNADRRELILARLLVVLQSVPGIKTVKRNVTNIDGPDRPAITLYDADENASEMLSSRNSARIAGANIIDMTPEMYILLGSAAEDVGPALNSFRLAVIKAIFNDADLKELTGANGGIKYEGCATALTRERGVAGELGLAVTYSYPLFPSKL